MRKQNNKTTIIVNLYRPPNGNQSDFLDHISDLTQAFQEDNLPVIYLTGDVNLDHAPKYLNETTNSLITLLMSYGLEQYIKEPTRVTASTKTTLDVMYVKTSKTIESVVSRSALSNHYLISGTRFLDYHKPPLKYVTGRT